MKIIWQVETADIKSIKNFYKEYINNPFVQNRIERNIKTLQFKISKNVFFKAMVSCLLTTQQRSGPDSAVTRFINTKPFPLSYKICKSKKNLQYFVQNVISDFGGLRRSNKIADEITTNINSLEKNLWDEIFQIINKLQSIESVQKERDAADFINNNFKGFGPKQSRNLLQSLGITKFEIPIDSRITKWLNNFNFPVKLSADALTDPNYYNFVSDGFQILCKKCKILPCVLDAAIFVSFDKSKWTKENVVW